MMEKMKRVRLRKFGIQIRGGVFVRGAWGGCLGLSYIMGIRGLHQGIRNFQRDQMKVSYLGVGRRSRF
jgi:hypothetical protein